MESFMLPELSRRRAQSGKLYHEFLRVPTMSAGVYEIVAGGVDSQQPHTEDELYYVVRGKASITVGAAEIPVEAGSLIFVAANVEHRFHDVAEDLTVLVFFAPAEYANRGNE